LAERTGLTVFSEFRERDLAAGGQGMPITALADWVQFRHADEPRLLLHLGGVTSIVYIPANARPQDVLAFECGPGTRLLDAVIRQGSGGKERYDAGGKYAVQGHCLDALVARWLDHPFLHARPPKSLPRSEFGANWVDRAARDVIDAKGSMEDFLCSLSHFVVKIVARACRQLPKGAAPLHIWLSGGGSRNGLFWRLLEDELPGVALHRLDELGVPTQARQATGAAVLAAMAVDGIPASSPNATGAVGRLLGKVTPGEPRNWARCLRWMAEQSSPQLTHPYRAA
jgi:anhydro-N-acetylmuramic acid kinase